MKIATGIDNVGPSETRPAGIGGAAQSGATQNAKSAPSTGFGDASSSDEASLSGVSRLLQSGSAQRTETLASLSSSVRSGSYQTSSSDVGRSMVSEILARSSSR